MTGRIGLYLLAGLIAYCLGSVSVGILVSRAAKGPDLRTVGSKNTGASNVLRTMGWKYGLLTFAGDCLKAVLACWIGRTLTGSPFSAMFAGLMVIIGHNWPVFFQLKGGKGVASSCGVMVFCFPVPALICFALTVALIAWTRYISLGSMFLLVLYAVIVSLTYKGDCWWFVFLWCTILAVICVARHHGNITRLLNGTENKLGKKPKT